MSAIEQVETGGKCDARGKSGEKGCLQFMPYVWDLYSKEILGEKVELEPQVERYVAVKKVEKWLAEGKTTEQVFKLWNQGHTGECSSGTNKYGVPYNSCMYVEKAVRYLAYANSNYR